MKPDSQRLLQRKRRFHTNIRVLRPRFAFKTQSQMVAITFVACLCCIFGWAMLRAQVPVSNKYRGMSKQAIEENVSKPEFKHFYPDREVWNYRRWRFEITQFWPPVFFQKRILLEITFGTNEAVIAAKKR